MWGSTIVTLSAVIVMCGSWSLCSESAEWWVQWERNQWDTERETRRERERHTERKRERLELFVFICIAVCVCKCVCVCVCVCVSVCKCVCVCVYTLGYANTWYSPSVCVLSIHCQIIQISARFNSAHWLDKGFSPVKKLTPSITRNIPLLIKPFQGPAFYWGGTTQWRLLFIYITYTHTRPHTHTHTCTDTRTHTYTHTNTPTLGHKESRKL